MVRVDITCDLMDEDETGHVWAFLRDARDQVLIQPGAIVVAGDEDSPAVAEVVDIVDKRPAGSSTFASCRASPRTIRQSSSERSYRPDPFPDHLLTPLSDQTEKMISQIPPNTPTAPILRVG